MLYGGQVNVKRTRLRCCSSAAKRRQAVYDAFEREFSEIVQSAGGQPARRRLPGQLRAEGHGADRKAGLARTSLCSRTRTQRGAPGLLAGMHEFAWTPVYSFEMVQPGNVV